MTYVVPHYMYTQSKELLSCCAQHTYLFSGPILPLLVLVLVLVFLLVFLLVLVLVLLFLLVLVLVFLLVFVLVFLLVLVLVLVLVFLLMLVFLLVLVLLLVFLLVFLAELCESYHRKGIELWPQRIDQRTEAGESAHLRHQRPEPGVHPVAVKERIVAPLGWRARSCDHQTK
jgi:predicted membrane protein